MEDYEICQDKGCPKCGHYETRYRSCDHLFCEDGFIDEHEDDPINFMPGESFIKCHECKGTGIIEWCPECGKDLTGLDNR